MAGAACRRRSTILGVQSRAERSHRARWPRACGGRGRRGLAEPKNRGDVNAKAPRILAPDGRGTAGVHEAELRCANLPLCPRWGPGRQGASGGPGSRRRPDLCLGTPPVRESGTRPERRRRSPLQHQQTPMTRCSRSFLTQTRCSSAFGPDGDKHLRLIFACTPQDATDGLERARTAFERLL